MPGRRLAGIVSGKARVNNLESGEGTLNRDFLELNALRVKAAESVTMIVVLEVAIRAAVCGLRLPEVVAAANPSRRTLAIVKA